MYVKFSFEEMVVKIPNVWAGNVVTLIAVPTIITDLNSNLSANCPVINATAKGGLKSYDYYYDCHGSDRVTIEKAIALFSGPVLPGKQSQENYGFYSDTDSGKLGCAEKIYNAHEYLSANHYDVYLKQFELAMKQVHAHHHPNTARFFQTFRERINQNHTAFEKRLRR